MSELRRLPARRPRRESRPRDIKYVLVDDLGRTIGWTTAEPGRTDEKVVYGLRTHSGEGTGFREEGHARMTRLLRVHHPDRRWDVQ